MQQAQKQGLQITTPLPANAVSSQLPESMQCQLQVDPMARSKGAFPRKVSVKDRSPTQKSSLQTRFGDMGQQTALRYLKQIFSAIQLRLSGREPES